MINDQKVEKIKAISKKATLNVVEELDKLNLTFDETYAGLLTCAALISSSIISSYAKRMNKSLSEVKTHFNKSIDDLIKEGNRK